MEIKDIKLRKERVDEFTVRHWYDAGTKHLPPCYAEKHYGYIVYNAEGKMLGPWGKYERLRTLKDVKAWIAEYDAIEDERIAAEAAEAAEREAYWKARKEDEEALTEAYKVPVVEENVPKVGDDLILLCPGLNKNCTIGEYLRAAKDDLEEGKDIKVKARVFGVVELTDAEYDDFVVNLMTNRDCWVPGENGTRGGVFSEDPRIADKEVWNLNKEEKEIWFATCRTVVHVVTAPNRRTFYVDTSGYEYARYVLLPLDAIPLLK